MNCPIGQFCNLDGSCTDLSSDQCDEDTSCVFGSGCYKGTCIPLFSLDDFTPVTSQDSSLCKSGQITYLIKTGYTCVPADKSVSSDRCSFMYYQAKFNSDEPEQIQGNQSPVCGFNQDPSAYCSFRKGDPIYLDFILKLQSIFSKPRNCHISSISFFPDSGEWVCDDVLKQVQYWGFREYANHVKSMVSQFGYALSANVDFCVHYSLNIKLPVFTNMIY